MTLFCKGCVRKISSNKILLHSHKEQLQKSSHKQTLVKFSCDVYNIIYT